MLWFLMHTKNQLTRWCNQSSLHVVVGGVNESLNEEVDFEEVTIFKVRLVHMVFSERTENETLI